MPYIVIMSDAWQTFTDILLDLRMAIRHQHINMYTKILQRLYASDEAFLLHVGAAAHFITLFKINYYSTS